MPIRKRPPSLNVAAGKSLGLKNEPPSLSVAEGKSSGIEKDSSLARPGVSGRKAGHSIVEYALPAMDLFKRTAGQGLSRARGNMAEYALPAMDLLKRTAGQGLSRARGNMAEYALPAMLLGLIVVGSAAALLNGDFAQTAASALFQAEANPALAGAKSLNLKTMGEHPLYRPFSYTSESGNVITLQNFPKDLASAIEVDGGHGTTEQLLAALESWVDALVAAGEITEAQGVEIKKLSNEGHRIAASQKIVEDFAAQCGTNKLCVQAVTGDVHHPMYGTFAALANHSSETIFGTANPAQYEGYSHTVTKSQYELFANIADNRGMVDAPVMFAGDYTRMRMGNDLYGFVSQMDKVLTNVPLSAANRDMLRYLGGSVVTMGVATGSALYVVGSTTVSDEVAARDQGLRDRIQARPDQMQEEIASYVAGRDAVSRSQMTHVQSGEICQMGQGKDDGGRCH